MYATIKGTADSKQFHRVKRCRTKSVMVNIKFGSHRSFPIGELNLDEAAARELVKKLNAALTRK